MTVKEAYKILNLSPGAEWEEVKKKYRQLIMQVHPDSDLSAKKHYTYNAQEINLAYAVLKKRNARHESISLNRDQYRAKEKKAAVWDAPVNENAYMEREVLHYVEDYEGRIIGNFCIAKGKYLWKTEEDFPLFLLSMYKCSKLLLDEIDSTLHEKKAANSRQEMQAELTYLLAQQFIDGTALLGELAKEEPADKEGNRFFYIPSMLEATSPAITPKAGEMLYPSGVRHHKLYLKDPAGQELGYLSFPDDRLYYIVVPLFEQKRVQIKVQVSETGKKNEGKSRKTAKVATAYQNLHLWMKLPVKTQNHIPENINLQIEQLLKAYGR